jgi:hypothetical protein
MCGDQIPELFKLIEEEESPFTISKKGKEILESICTTYPSMVMYK